MDGADGQLRVYGDGTAGAVMITADTNWIGTPPPDDNYQFTDFTVAAGATLIVMSGTVIRCTGTCTNNGTILVGYGAPGGIECMNPGVGLAHVVEPGPDAFGLIAGFGEASSAGTYAYGGVGYGPIDTLAEALTNVGYSGGGGGAGNGGHGGGAITILAEVGVVNAGAIVADAQAADLTLGCQQGGGGGGAGGVVILASKGHVVSNGAISVQGGTGGPSSAYFAPGGGGAGGIVHLFAPTITVTGALNVNAGANGTGTGTLTQSPRGAGNAGGSCGGYGGSGADVNASNAITAALQAPALVGHVFQSHLDPTALFY
jgi:hypothetical protein